MALTLLPAPGKGKPVAIGLALMALAILEGHDLRSLDRNSVESFHLQIEAMKLAMEVTPSFGETQRKMGETAMRQIGAKAWSSS